MQISRSDPEQPTDPECRVRSGAHVRVRGARWRIVDVQPHDACSVVTLTPLGAAGSAAQRRVIEPFDRIEPLQRLDQPRVVGPRRWRRACRAVIAADNPPNALIAARLAQIALMPHQLEPAMAVLDGRATRVLLADAVGLGKTIEAALIVSELRTRGWIDRVLVLTPAGLRDQWRHELEDRFGLEAVHVDAQTLRHIATTRPVGVNPWTTVSTAIASVDYVKRAEVLPAVCACRWDLVIVDEAHGVVGDSARHGAVSALAASAAYVLLLTATPHNGDAVAYDALRNLGAVDADPLLIFRRTRSALFEQPERRVRTLGVRQNRHERRVHAALTRYGDAVSAEAEGVSLAMSVLHKRAYSSAWALQQSVERRLAALSSDSDAAAEQLTLPLGDAMGEFSTADEAPEWPQELALADPRRECGLLTAVADACAAVTSESKVAALIRLLRRIKESAIVFTEYRDTLQHLRRLLSGIRVVVLHGGLTRQERADVVQAFSSAEQPTVLLATDAAGEGLNLQRRCRFVVNLELPWNPMRLEQRIGRVDRIGQTRRVHVVHLVARGTGESAILARLRSRIVRAQTAIGAANPLGDEHVEVEQDAAATTVSDAATAEADRLRLARAFTAVDDERLVDILDGGGPWIVRGSKLRRLRKQIGATAAVIVRTTLEHESGRRLASRLRAVLFDGVPQTGTHDAMRTLTRELAKAAVHRLDTCDDWAECARQRINRFAAARIDREKSIAAAVEGISPALFQTSLFDRRAERSHDAQAAHVLDAQQEVAARIASLEAVAAHVAVTHHVLLAVVS